MVMPHYTLVLISNRKTRIQVRSDLACQLPVVHKDENAGLRFHRKGRREEALVVLEILDTVDNLVSRVDCIRTVRGYVMAS